MGSSGKTQALFTRCHDTASSSVNALRHPAQQAASRSSAIVTGSNMRRLWLSMDASWALRFIVTGKIQSSEAAYSLSFDLEKTHVGKLIFGKTICVTCNTEFIRTSAPQIYCTLDCRKKDYRKIIIKECIRLSVTKVFNIPNNSSNNPAISPEYP